MAERPGARIAEAAAAFNADFDADAGALDQAARDAITSLPPA